jgi:hypothetical protein
VLATHEKQHNRHEGADCESDGKDAERELCFFDAVKRAGFHRMMHCDFIPG